MKRSTLVIAAAAILCISGKPALCAQEPAAVPPAPAASAVQKTDPGNAADAGDAEIKIPVPATVITAPSGSADIASPETAVPATPEEEDPTAQLPLLTLEDCIEYCLQHHPDIQAAKANITSYEGRLRQTLSSYYPDINYTGGYTHTSNRSGSVVSTLNNVSDDYNQGGESYTHRIGLRQYIWDFGKTPAQVDASREQLKATTFNTMAVINNTVANMKRAYYNYIGAQELVRVNELQLEVQQLHLNEARNFYQQGKKARNEVTQAEVNVANAQYDLIKSKKDSYNAYLTLKNALGISDPGYDFSVVKSLEKRNLDFTLEEVRNTAFRYRPEIARYSSLIKAQEYSLKSIKAEYFPSISGETGVTWNGNHYPLSRTVSAGLSVSLNLFDSGAKAGRITDASGQLEALEAQSEKVRQDIGMEVGQAYNTLIEAQVRMDVATKASELARENYELARGRYDAGLSTNTEFNDARYSLFQSETNLITATVEYLNAYTELEKSMGERLYSTMRELIDE